MALWMVFGDQICFLKISKLNINLVVVASCLTFPCSKKKATKIHEFGIGKPFFLGPFFSEKVGSWVSTWSSPIFRQHAEDGYSGGCVEDSPHRVGTRCDVHGGGGNPSKIIREQNKMLSLKLKHGYRSSRKKCLFATLVCGNSEKSSIRTKPSHEVFGGHWTSRLACLEVVGWWFPI